MRSQVGTAHLLLSEESSHPLHREVMAAWHSLPEEVKTGVNVVSPAVAATIPNDKAPASRLALSESMAAYRFRSICAGLDRRGKSLLLLSSMAGANEWLNTFPTFPNAQLSDGRCRSAYEIWLGAPQSILCGPAATDLSGRTSLDAEIAEDELKASDTAGRDILNASSAARIGTHDCIKGVVCDLFLEAGLRTYEEVSGFYGDRPDHSGGAGRRLDIVGIHLSTGRRLSVDVVRVNGTTDGLLESPSALERPDHGLVLAEQRKTKTYDTEGDRPEGYDFVPFAIGTQNELGTGAVKLLGYLAAAKVTRMGGTGPPCDKAVKRERRYMCQRIGLACMLGQTEQILAKVIGSPHAALAEAKRHVHSIHASFARSSRQPCTCGASSAGFCVCHSHG